MRKEHTSRMMQPTSFSDFNPLDVLATAASLQRRTEDDGNDNENQGDKSNWGSDKCEEESESKDGGEEDDVLISEKTHDVSVTEETHDVSVTVDVFSEGEVSASGEQTVNAQNTPEESNQLVSNVSKETPCGSNQDCGDGSMKGPEPYDNSKPVAMKKPQCVLQIVNCNGGKSDVKPVMTLRDATKLIVPTRQGNKALTVLKINKQQMTDHSYAFVCQLQNLKHEEDEGYSSRSSLDDENEDCRIAAAKAGQMSAPSPLSSPNLEAKRGHLVRECQPALQHSGESRSTALTPGGSVRTPPTTPTVVTSGEQMRRATKIVIVSKDSKLQHIMSEKDSGASVLIGIGNTDSSLKAGSSEMLRTLLRQKPKSVHGTTEPSKVLVAGSLPDHVVNVLKSGHVALAPPISSRKSVEATKTKPSDGKLGDSSVLQTPETKISTKSASCVQLQTQTLSSTTNSHSLNSVSGDHQRDCRISPTRKTAMGDSLPETSETVEQTSHSDVDPKDNVAKLSRCDNSSASLAGQVQDNGQGSEGGAAAPWFSDNDAHSNVESAQEHYPVNDGEESSVVPGKDFNQESEGSLPECERSQDSSDAVIAVDTAPVPSPSTDSQSALMSPVSERDAPMMSPMVNSMELCDLFKLPSVVKQLAADRSMSLPNCDLTVGCVAHEDDHTQASLSSTDSQAEASPGSGELAEGDPVGIQPGESLLMTSSAQLSPNSDVHPNSESGDSEVSVLVTPDPPMENADEAHGSCQIQQDGENETSAEKESKDLQPVQPDEMTSTISRFTTEENCRMSGTEMVLPESHLPLSGAPVTPDPELDENEDENSPTTPDLGPSSAHDSSSSAKNQYIIEDDESPVTKFGTPRSSAGEESPASNCSSPIALPVPSVTPTSSAGTSENSNSNSIEAPLRETVKVLVTPDSTQKSVFTAVRRPVVSGLNALPGNLQVVPVLPQNKSKGNIMHVVPVSCARIIPKPGQYITGVPVLGGKTVVQVSEANKGRVSTLLVPLSVTTSSSSGAPVSLVQGPKTKLINLRNDSSSRLSSTDSESAWSPSISRKDVSSPLVFHGRITPLSSTTSDNSDLMSSPENSLQGGFSGLIMGRCTPENNESTRYGVQSLESSPKDKINIRISASSVLESDDSMSSEPSFTSKKESIGIGTMGSLSWKNVETSSTSKCLTPIGTGQGSGPEFVRIQGGEVKRGIPVAQEKSVSSKRTFDQQPRKVGRPLKSGGASVSKTLHAYSRKRRKLSSDAGSPSVVPPPVTQPLYIPHVSQLHPLIDHDYCMFTEFNAQIQSSIIATTESKAKIEKKYAKKTKVVRTKAVRGVMQEDHIKASVKLAAEKAVTKGRRGRLKKRLLAKEKMVLEEEQTCERTEELQEKTDTNEAGPMKKQAAVEPRPSRTSERRARLQALKDNKNYVKITGSYQDEFVYFATKNKRCRPRKSADSDLVDPQLTKQPQVGGMTVFDWYHDLAKADKTSRFGTPTGSRFGTPTASGASSPVPFSTGVGDNTSTSARHTVSNLSRSGPDTSTSTKSIHGHQDEATPSYPPNATLLHESEVADLVCDLSEINTLGNSIDNAPGTGVNDMDKQLFTFLGGSDLKTETVTTTTEEGTGSGVDMNFMAEQVRTMLNSMGEDELQMLGKELGSGSTGMADTSFDGFLSGFTPEAPPGMHQPATSNNLCDLDEINDSDLLQSDISSMNVILGDFKESSSQAIKTQIPSGPLKTSASAPSLLLDVGEKLPGLGGFTKALDLGTVKLDKTELFPDMAPPPTDVTVNDTMAPELTVVSMYWNDLPGLMIRGEQYVRLVDIHKQVLPAKDTGILKKRCQMMGLAISNCTELQRDFLVRYANAAKSKSTVVVAKEAAQTLIGFYVEPKSRAPKQSSEDRMGVAGEQVEKAKGSTVGKKQQVVEAGESAQSDAAISTTETPTTPNTPASAKDKSSVAGTPKNRTGCKRTSRKRRLTDSDSSPGTPLSNGDVKRSARLRHKKVCYSDMLLGNHYDSPEKKEKDISDIPAAQNSVESKLQQKLKELPPVANIKGSDESEVSDDHENKDVRRGFYPEDLEIRKLKAKMRRKSLSQGDKKKLRRLRDKVRKREIKRKLRERRKQEKLRNKQKTLSVSQIVGLAKSKRKLQETHVYTKKYNQEHCYAAAPEVSHEKPHPKNTVVVAKEVPEEQTTVAETPKEVPATTTEEITHKDVLAEEPKEGVKEGPKEGPKEEPKKEPENKMEELKTDPEASERPPLLVLHRDSVHRVNQRGRWQEGALHLDRYQALDSLCIQCITCRDYFSLKRFMKHMHHQNNRDELAHVTLSQKLELSSPSPTEEEATMWNDFQVRRQELATVSSKAKSDARQKSASRVTNKSVERPRDQLPVNSTINNKVRESVKNVVKNKTVKKVTSPSGVKKAGKQTTPSSTRHSTRVRKRKQLHPIEKYVFSKLSPNAEPPSKKARIENEDIHNESEVVCQGSDTNGCVQGTPVRGLRLRLSSTSSKQTFTKYDLRGGSGSTESDSKRPTKVLGKRNKNTDTNVTAMEDKVTDKAT